ncbi:nuclear transport factor 2 family protein [Candidatus Sumerlaeota bacterium]|nr:nuclear transport factor 2 family protein [Candidatus Sumerlaeota bacterium]
MNKISGIFVLMSVIAATCFQPAISPALTGEQEKAIETAVLNADAEIVQAAERLDAEAMFSNILDSGKCVIIQNGKLMSRQEALASTQASFAELQQLEYNIETPQITILSPESALLVSHGQSTATTKSGQTFTTDFAVTDIYILKDNGWKLVHGHHSIPIRRSN